MGKNKKKIKKGTQKNRVPKQPTKEQPFSDYVRPEGIAGWIDPKFNDLPFKTYFEQIAQKPAGVSEKLKVLVGIYEMYDSKKQALHHLEKAIDDFWQGGYLTTEERAILLNAEAGDIESIQLLVKANPEVIYLPFVAEGLIEILREYRNALTPKYLIERKWRGFLPPAKSHPFSKWDLGELVKKAQEQITHTKEEAIELVAKKLGIGVETIRKKARFKDGKGRPRKK